MIDIHSHIIYGIDDGPKNLDDSIAMLQMAIKDGINGIIATSHYNNIFNYDMKEMEKNFYTILKKVFDEKLEIELYLGNEAYLDEFLLGALLSGNCKTLGKSQYVLIEIDYNASFNIVEKMLFDIMINGYIPIIAHCERLVRNEKDCIKLLKLKNRGCLLQINSSAILKAKKKWLKKWMIKRLKDNTISFISSDAHDIKVRKPILKEAYNIVRKKAGEDIAYNVFIANPKKIIFNEAIN